MAQLFFEYGVMASGKSIEILKVTHNYSQQNRKVLLLTSSLDDTFGWQNGSDSPFSFNFIMTSFLAPTLVNYQNFAAFVPNLS